MNSSNSMVIGFGLHCSLNVCVFVFVDFTVIEGFWGMLVCIDSFSGFSPVSFGDKWALAMWDCDWNRLGSDSCYTNQVIIHINSYKNLCLF